MTPTETLPLELRIPARSEFVAVARLVVAAVASRLGCDLDTIDDLKVVVGEACACAISINAPDTTATMLLRCDFPANALQLTLEAPLGECAHGGEARHQGPFPTSYDLSHLVIEALMDEATIRCTPETGLHVSMLKRLPHLASTPVNAADTVTATSGGINVPAAQ